MAENDTLIGARVGRYEIQEFLREDKLGRVYLAHELPSKKLVDVKVLDTAFARDNEMFGRFGRELLATATINHPNCVAMLDFGDHRSVFHYLVLEHVDAKTIADELEEHGKFPWERVVRIAHQIAGALKAAHDEKIIHRALCPANFLLLHNADGDFVKIRDFGLSRLVEEGTEGAEGANLTAAGARVGSAEYMAPEYINAAIVHRRGDLYALGICMFEMLTGKPPFTGSSALVLVQHVSEPAPRVSSLVKVPAWLDDLIASLLAKEMEARPENAAAVIAALESGLGKPIELPKITAPGAVPREASAKKGGTDGVGAGLASVAVIAGVAVIGLVLLLLVLAIGLAVMQ